MEIRNRISPAVLAAATGMLQPFIPELSPESLVSAIKSYETKNTNPTVVAEKPLTRQEAATLLSVSKNSITRYMNMGILRRISIGERLVRIDPQSVRDLLEKGIEG